jgi:hypothetical protein
MWCKLLLLPDQGAGLVWADNRGVELRSARYEVLDTLLASAGVAPLDERRPVEPSVPVSAVVGDYIRAGAQTVTVRATGRADDLCVSDAAGRCVVGRAGADVWDAGEAASGDEKPPWLPHVENRRGSIGVRTVAGEVTHLYLNGLPYRRSPVGVSTGSGPRS